MINPPHSRTDLLLAPLVLDIDERLETMASLSAKDLEARVALDANVDTTNPHQRLVGLLIAVTQQIDMRGWQASLHPRGVKLEHSDHSIVLGVPATFAAFLDGSART